MTASTSPLPTDAELRVKVNLGPRSYDVRVVSDQPEKFGAFAREALYATWAGHTCRRVLVVADENVVPLQAPFANALKAVGLSVTSVVIPSGECSKSLDRAVDLYDELVKLRADRHTAILALGGGVVGDLAGFVAATYARGLPLLMVPTTLLAQVDSSVGGKVGVNHPRCKNIIGAFHQPVGVWIDTAALDNLPTRELQCGLAEVVKYGVILDAGFFHYLEEHVELILSKDPREIRHIIARSCELKAGVVSRDEREETGLRAVLNYGHTIAHAIESVAGYGGAFQHGEAVSVGMVAEAKLAERLGWLAPGLADQIAYLLERFGLPTSAPGFDSEALLDAMSRDKKNQKGKTRFVLPRRIGQVELTDAPSDLDIRAALAIL